MLRILQAKELEEETLREPNHNGNTSNWRDSRTIRVYKSTYGERESRTYRTQPERYSDAKSMKTRVKSASSGHLVAVPG